MHRMMLLLVAAMFALPIAVTAQATAPSAVKVVKVGDASMLTGAANGMTLYTNAQDTPGKSMCNGACATNWPPLAAGASDKAVGKYTIVTRDDGSMQWAYGGMPLYYWKNDKAAGDTTGDGVAGRWHVARP